MMRLFHSIARRICALFLLPVFVVTGGGNLVRNGFAQDTFPLPVPGVMVALSQPYKPPILKGVKVYAADPFRFDFILDQGDKAPSGMDRVSQPAEDTASKRVPDEEVLRLVKYFLAGLTVPEQDLWVNLSPYEKDRIIPEALGRTEMGRDLLSQDYILKQVTASLIYPEGETGKKFWAEVYKQAHEKYGTIDIPVDTFNKVWIAPVKVVVYEKGALPNDTASALVVESRLKVMLESDYFAESYERSGEARLRPALFNVTDRQAETSVTSTDMAKDILREVVIPVLEKEVNEGKNFAPLRQVYHSLILAAWYKKKVRDSILAGAYVDQNKIAGITIEDASALPSGSAASINVEHIYRQYVEAFKKGAYNYIKEEYDAVTRDSVPRKYFSGGIVGDMAMMEVSSDNAMLKSPYLNFDGEVIEVKSEPVFDPWNISSRFWVDHGEGYFADSNNKRPLFAVLNFCLAVAMRNPLNGQRFMAHALPTGPMKLVMDQEHFVSFDEMSTVNVDQVRREKKIEYIKQLFANFVANVVGDQRKYWIVDIVESKSKPKALFDDAFISKEDLRGYLIYKLGIDPTKIVMRPETYSSRNVTMFFDGKVDVKNISALEIKVDDIQTPGGIDLTPSMMKVDVQGNDRNMVPVINAQVFARMQNAHGLAPVIMNRYNPDTPGSAGRL